MQCLGNYAIDNDFNNSNVDHIQQVTRNQIADEKSNVILCKKQTHMELVQYLHVACFSPVPSPFKKAIQKGFLQTWPGSTTELVDKHVPPIIVTVQGHIVQE